MGPLHGFRVLDFTAVVSGPVGAAMLADQGAEVIKIEPPGGELIRRSGSGINNIPAMFYTCNRGKKSVCVDLSDPQGIELIHELMKTADVVLQNFRPGVTDRMGIGYETARSLNEGIVYASISGFGTKGPYSHRRVYDPVIQALSGTTDLQADRVTHEPAMMRTVVADKVTSLALAQAVSAALLHRERTGEGQHIELSMLDAMLSFLWPGGMASLTYAEQESDPRASQWSRDLVFATRDGYVTAGALSESEWQGLCRALGKPELMEDPRFATPGVRARHAEERLTEMANAIATFTTEEIVARLDENQVPGAPLLRRTELLANEQIIANNSIQRLDVEGFGEVRQPMPAARFGATPQDTTQPAPQLGEHSVAVMKELGYSDERIDRLLADAVVIANPGVGQA